MMVALEASELRKSDVDMWERWLNLLRFISQLVSPYGRSRKRLKQGRGHGCLVMKRDPIL